MPARRRARTKKLRSAHSTSSLVYSMREYREARRGVHDPRWLETVVEGLFENESRAPQGVGVFFFAGREI